MLSSLGDEMRAKFMLCVVLSLATSAFAKEPKPYQTGTLLQMNSVECGAPRENANHSVVNKPGPLVCQEYLLQSENVTYRIRPSRGKHAPILPVGERAQFRLEKDKLIIRTPVDSKEREYSVISVMPASASSAAQSTVPHLNHLQ